MAKSNLGNKSEYEIDIKLFCSSKDHQLNRQTEFIIVKKMIKEQSCIGLFSLLYGRIESHAEYFG
jgi:hypothetical protein